jgi:hypothetical protein
VRVPNELLRETIVIRPYGGSGARGPVYEEPISVRASVQQTQRLMTDFEGVSVTVDTLVILRPEVGVIRAESKIEWNGETFRVIRSYPMPDGRRPSQIEVAMARYAGAVTPGASGS